MAKRNVTVVVILYFLTLTLNAQFPPQEIDYTALVKKAKGTDQEALTAKLQLGYYFVYRGKNIDSTVYYLNYLEERITQLDAKHRATLYNLKGKYFLDRSGLDSAMVYFEKSRRMADELDYKVVMADSRNGKAAIAIYSSNYEEAIDQLLESLSILEGIGDDIELAMYEYNIGMFYVFTKNYERAKLYQFKSLKRLEKIEVPPDESAMRYGALCNIYLKEKKIDSAEFCFSKITDNGDEKYNNYYYFKGEIALAKKENSKAVANFEKSLDLLGNYREKEIAIRLNKIAQAYLNLEHSKKALGYLKKADSLIGTRSFPSLRRKQDSLYYEAYQLLENPEKSLLYLQRYQESINRSLPISKIQAANNTENSYQIQKKEQFITSQESVIRGYISKNKLLSLLVVVSSLGLVFFLIGNYHKRKKLDREKVFIEAEYSRLNSQNLELNEKLEKIAKKLTATDRRTKASKYKRSSLSDEQREVYMNSILNFIVREKPYLHSELTQKTLSDLLGISAHHLSEVLNISFGKNFYGFINLYRVEEAKKIIAKDTKNLTMLAVAYNAGFNSKASFNRVFKEVAGVTPTEFKKTTRPQLE